MTLLKVTTQCKAEQERLAEDLRLLYVALTRAVHFCSVGMHNIAQGRSALALVFKVPALATYYLQG